MNLSDLFIDNGSSFTIRQLKERLNLMGIQYDKEDVNKSTLIRLYDEALTDENNKRKILKELISDTNAKNKVSNKDIINRREPINIEVSKEPKFSRNLPITTLNLTANSELNSKLNDLVPQNRNQQKSNYDSHVMSDDSKLYNPQSFNDFNKENKLAVSNGKPFFDEKTRNEINHENVNKGKIANNLSSRNDINMESQAISNARNIYDHNPNKGEINQAYLDKEQINRIKNLGNLNNRNTIAAKEFNNNNQNALKNLPPNFIREPIVQQQQQQLSMDADNRKSASNIPNFSFGNANQDNANNRSFMPTRDSNQIYQPNNLIGNNSNNPSANNILRNNVRNTLPNFKNIDESNNAGFTKIIDYQEKNLAPQQQQIDDKASNKLRASNNFYPNYNLQPKNSLSTIKEADNEYNSNSLNKKEIVNTAETVNTGVNRISSKLNFDKSNANLIGLNSVNTMNYDVNGTLNRNYQGMDSINAAKNLQTFGNINPYPIQELNTPNNQSFLNNYNNYPNKREENYPAKPNITRADFNRETSSKSIPDINKKIESSKLNADSYPNPANINNLLNTNLQTQNQPNIREEQFKQQQARNQNYNQPIIQENSRPFGRRSTQSIHIQKQVSNNQLIDINPQSTDQMQIGPVYPSFSINNNIQKDFDNIPYKRTSTGKIVGVADSIMDVNQPKNQKRMMSGEDQNIPFEHPETQGAKATEGSHLSEFRNIFVGLFLFGLMILSFAGLNHAHVINIDHFATQTVDIMRSLTPENAISLFDAFIGILLQIIQRILARILAFTGASIWNNIYIIIFLIIAVIIIRHFYLRVHYNRIANDIYEVIRNRLRAIRRANSNDYRAGIRVDEIINEFSQNYSVSQNAFRDNILPLLKTRRSKDEDIRSFGENEGGKYYEKWQFKGI